MRLSVLALVGLVSAPALAFEPGSLGEHYRDTGHVQGCTEGGELPACTIIAGGSQFVVPLDGPTPAEVMATLRAMAPLTYVEFRGDILNINDSYAEFALGAIVEADAAGDPHGATLRAMQGEWVSAEDAKAQVRIEGLVWTDVYDGEAVASSVISLGEGCADGSDATGEVLELFAIGSLDAGSLCYSDVTVAGGRMEATYVAGGNRLVFAAAK